LLGLLFVPLTIDFYFGFSPSTHPPRQVGQAITVLGVVTLVAWAIRLAGGRLIPPPSLRTAGRIALAAAVVVGFAQLLPEIGRIIPPE
jgi:hypothetical protein